MTIKPLEIKQLYRSCETELLPFKTTSELKPLDAPLGQERAMAAIDFGINVDFDGYNIFCVGPEGTGKTNLIKRQITKRAKQIPAPDDWCYINNFESPHKPKALRLPAGNGLAFAKDVEKLIENLSIVIPSAFEGEEYRNRLKIIEEHFAEQKERYFNELQFKSKSKKVSILRMPVGLVVAPMKNGEVISPEAFDKLPEKEKQEILSELNEAQAELAAAVADVPKWEKEQHEEIDKLNEEVANFAVSHMIEVLREKYSSIKPVLNYLKDLQKDIIDNVSLFMKPAEVSSEQGQSGANSTPASGQHPFSAAQNQTPSHLKIFSSALRRYAVNVIVKHKKDEGAPIVFLDNPTLPNLVGRMERLQQSGSVIMDFNLLKSGALHEANGGFLIIDAKHILSHPPAWEALKRALRSKKIAIEAQDNDNNVITTIMLDPEPIDLNLKVIIMGDPEVYNIIAESDPEFSSLFKISAHFTSTMNRTKDSVNRYARLIADLVKEKSLRALSRSATAKVIEYSSRLAGDSEKLSTHTSLISDLLKESDYFARINSSNSIGRNHVEQALAAKIKRSDSLREIMNEQISRGIIMIETKGKVIGQVNALVVFDFAGFAFGRPSRITGQARIGKGEVIDIEREVELGGPTHSKGVLILSSFLSSRFARDIPLSLEASLTFEQSYGEVDGDSASSAELYALISAISETPIRQDLAVTGSVNQFGQIQAIGAVNEKIEGFFDTCKMKGLTGTQGVLIPKANVPHLMLREDVLSAAKEGKFHIYPISTIDEGIELLTDIPAGKPDKNGEYPIGTINRRVKNRLEGFYQKSMPPKGFSNKEER